MTDLGKLLDRLWLQTTDNLSTETVDTLGDDPVKILEVGYKMGVTNTLQLIGLERPRRRIVTGAIREAVALYRRLGE